jgi:hypothetical protein
MLERVVNNFNVRVAAVIEHILLTVITRKVRKKVDILKMLFTIKSYSGIPPRAENIWPGENCNIRNYDEIK